MMAEHMDPVLEAQMRAESERTRYDEYPPDTVVVRPNLERRHVVNLTAMEQRKLAEEARRRNVDEGDLLDEWVKSKLA